MFDFIHALLKGTPYDAYHIELKKKRGQIILVIEIEKAGYINIEDCQTVSRLIEPAIEHHDEFKEALIEVASADPERELKTFKQYQNALGKTLKVITDKTIEGTLDQVSESNIQVQTKNELIEIPFNTIKNTFLTIVF